ncbi:MULTISPECIES: hypothetical protein [Haloferacaceae]|uniref:Uncharacterized protein n=2 Tax=Haloferacaceae TaxID=1644056 RepID=A0ABD6DBQ1_9EURY|nr:MULTISPECIES: hypothetical protein [Halorubraceae]
MLADRDHVTLEPQGYDGSETFPILNGRRIDELSILFNIPVEELTSKYMLRLEELRADKTFENDYDGYDVFHLKCQKALESAINTHDPRVKNARADDVVAENVGHMYTEGTTDWSELALTWLTEWLRLYNSNLRYNTNDLAEGIFEAIRNAAENEYITRDEIDHLVDVALSEEPTDHQ